MMADNETFYAVNARDAAFSHMKNYLTTTTATQGAQGTTGATQIADWDARLMPKDGRAPFSSAGKIPFWDAEPIEMRTDIEIAAAQARQRTVEVKAKAMPRPAAKPYPKSGASSSNAGPTAKAKAKSSCRPSG